MAALGLIPFAVLVLKTALIRTFGYGWRTSFLRASLLWGTLVVLSAEFLSLFRAVSQRNLILLWGLAAAVTAVWLLIRSRQSDRVFQLPSLSRWNKLDLLLLSTVVAIGAVAALVALLTPPQTWDSLIYHLSRVAHWAQAGGAVPYATGIGVQNSRPPGAELVILHLYVLGQGDLLATMVAWTAVAGSVIGGSLLAAQLGARRRGQLFSAVFAATIPMAIVQASSTMNDAVVAWWMICLASEIIRIWGGRWGWPEVVFAGLATGLAVATKPTSLAYLIPFSVLAGVLVMRQKGVPSALLAGSVVVAVVTLISAGYWSRNLRIYGSFVNPDEARLHADQPRTPAVVVSNLLRNSALHAGTASPHANKALALGVIYAHDLLGLEVSDPRTTSAGRFRISRPSTHENTAGNLPHAVLILAALGLILFRKRERSHRLLIYSLTVTATFLCFSLLFKWQIFGSRYHLPFFLLWAPSAGWTMERMMGSRLAGAVALVLVAYSWPYLTGIESRPLLARGPDEFPGSILEESRRDLYFGNGPYLIEPYRQIAERINAGSCDQIGVMLSGNSPEYLLWALMGAPRGDLRMEWIVSGTPSAEFADPDFAPCAVVCERCPSDWDTVRGLPESYRHADFRLFLRTGAE